MTSKLHAHSTSFKNMETINGKTLHDNMSRNKRYSGIIYEGMKRTLNFGKKSNLSAA